VSTVACFSPRGGILKQNSKTMDQIQDIDWKEVRSMIDEEVAAVNGPYTSGKRVIAEIELEDGSPCQIQIIVTRDQDDFS